MNVWTFLRRHFVRIVTGAVLAMTVFFVMLVWMPYQHEQRIARKIEAIDEGVTLAYHGPNWIPQSIRDRIPLFQRIDMVFRNANEKGNVKNAIPVEMMPELGSLSRVRVLILSYTQVTDTELEPLAGLTTLEFLELDHSLVTDEGLGHLKELIRLDVLNLEATGVTDAGLKRLMPLTGLTSLGLRATRVTDAGLEHLKGLTNLESLRLTDTQTTAEGRAMLRKALPNCEIEPAP